MAAFQIQLAGALPHWFTAQALAYTVSLLCSGDVSAAGGQKAVWLNV